MIRVGLVDDQQMVRVGLKMILESEHDIVVCCEAASGEEAIVNVAEHRPDVVLMDIRMPGMDGLAATREVLRVAPDVRVVILTTFDDDEYLYGALRAGASGFLLKSADGDALVNAVRVVAGGEGLLAPEVTRRVIEQFARSPITGGNHAGGGDAGGGDAGGGDAGGGDAGGGDAGGDDANGDDAGKASAVVPAATGQTPTGPSVNPASVNPASVNPASVNPASVNPADPQEHVPSPEAIGDLSAREVQVLQLMARGMSNQEIAQELFVSNTTVKTHVSHILTKLGVRDRVQAVVEAYDSGIVLPRP